MSVTEPVPEPSEKSEYFAIPGQQIHRDDIRTLLDKDESTLPDTALTEDFMHEVARYVGKVHGWDYCLAEAVKHALSAFVWDFDGVQCEHCGSFDVDLRSKTVTTSYTSGNETVTKVYGCGECNRLTEIEE